MRPDSITLAIFEKYSPAELAETAQKMANAQSNMEAAEAEKKVSDGVFNERIKTHAAEVSELAQKYNKGGETAQIGCRIRYDIPTAGKKSYIRMDTEETVEVHDMTETEKQETFQFPLTASPEKKPDAQSLPAEPAKPAPAKPEAPAAKAPISFKDFQQVAVHIAKLAAGDVRDAAIADMASTMAAGILEQKSVIGPDGRVEAVDSADTANKLAGAWLKLAIEHQLNPPPPKEEVTRICPYPGCILFAEHDGLHEFPPVDGPKGSEPKAAEPQLQPEKKAKRKKRGFAPAPEGGPEQPGAQA